MGKLNKKYSYNLKIDCPICLTILSCYFFYLINVYIWHCCSLFIKIIFIYDFPRLNGYQISWNVLLMLLKGILIIGDSQKIAYKGAIKILSFQVKWNYTYIFFKILPIKDISFFLLKVWLHTQNLLCLIYILIHVNLDTSHR